MWGFPSDPVRKNLPTIQETRVPSRGREDPLEESMATHSSILSCLEKPMDRGAWQAIVHKVTKSWTQLKLPSTHTHRNLNHI